MGGNCERCGQQRQGEERWCSACGLDFRPAEATLPTPDAIAAGDRERAFFEEHPELAAEQRQREENAQRARERQEIARLSKLRPPSFDEYRDVSWRARLARGWLLIVAGLTVLCAILEIGHLNILAGTSTAELDLVTAQRIDDSNSALTTAYLITFCAYVFSAGFFAAWTFRAYKNAIALGAQRPRFGPGWAIGGWFVPVLGLWRPKQIVNDIWRASDPEEPPLLRNWHERAVPGLLAVWWALYIISNLVDRISARVPTDTIEHERSATGWALAASVVTVLAALLATLVVRRLTARQRERAAALEKLPAPA